MDKKLKIWAPYFTRSEFGPLDPLLEKLEEDGRFSVQRLNWTDHRPTLGEMIDEFKLNSPDAVFCCFDRPEMVPVAYASYHADVPAVQVFAGDIAGGAYDDADRFAISQYASILFCSSMVQKERLEKALEWKKGIGQFPRICVSGPTHLDDMFWINPPETDITYGKPGYLWPLKYDLVLYNPPSMLGIREIKEEVDEIFRLIGDGYAYWFAPNGDRHSDWLVDRVHKMMETSDKIRYFPSMERLRFLGYLVNATRFIGNSSALFYEGPALDVECVQVGVRNKYRETVRGKGGASRKIADELYEFLKTKGG